MGNNLSYKKDFGLVVVGAILFTASFLWIEFLMEVENVYFPKKNGLSRRFLYTLVITVILVSVAVILRKWFGINGNHKDVDINGRTNKNGGPIGGEAGMTEAGMGEAGMTEAGMGEAGMGEAALAENTGLKLYGQ